MKVLNIDKFIHSEDEFYSSNYFDEIWKGYQGKGNAERIGRKSRFIIGFVTKEDPERNYGRDFNLYKCYATEEGIRFVSKVEKSSCLSSSPLTSFIIDYKLKQVTQSGSRYDKSDRKLLKKLSNDLDMIFGDFIM